MNRAARAGARGSRAACGGDHGAIPQSPEFDPRSPPRFPGPSEVTRRHHGTVLPSHPCVDTLRRSPSRPAGSAEDSTIDRLTARLFTLLVVAFHALSISSTIVADDDIPTLRAKAEKGDETAQLSLVTRYEFGVGVPRNLETAVKWLRKAAEQGNAEAQYDLGVQYNLGAGVPKDDREAVNWYRKSAEQGNADARYTLGVKYTLGEGVREDDREAVKWYRKAAEQGSAPAQYNLGVKYSFGEGVREDDREAVKWFRKAAEQGYADAQFNLAMSYLVGEGVRKDDREGVKWLRKAADQGHADAQNNLAFSYEFGEGVPKDDREAVRWLRKAAEQGDAKAQYNLGVKYNFGQGVAKDEREAVKWYRKAAEQGDPDAQFNLGVSYFNGNGIPKDHVTAYAWVNLAAAQGHANAKKSKPVVTRRMTAGQIAEAHRLSRQFEARIARRKSRNTQGPGSVSGQVAVTATGFFVTDDGYFVTNAHAVGDASRVRVMTKRGTFPARVIHRDTTNDLALLKVAGSFKSLPVISSRRLREGSRVFTFGHPTPDVQGVEPVYTSGDISELTGIGDDPRTLQISVPLQPGNSGGPLVDEHGNVVGVVVARLDVLKLLLKTDSLPRNVNYAVKSTRLLSLLEAHIPDAGEKLKAGFPGKSRDLADVRNEVRQATVLILVERSR